MESKSDRWQSKSQSQGQNPDADVRRYIVRKPFVKDILFRLDCGQPDCDVFGAVHNQRQLDGVMAVTRKNKGLLWLNPPFGVLKQVLNKLILEKLKAVLIAPHWPGEDFFKLAQPFIQKKYYYKAGQQFFEESGEIMGSLPWPVWGWLIDGGNGKDVKKR